VPGADLKFETAMLSLVNPYGETEGIPYASSSEENYGWGLLEAVDGNISSTTGDLGWVSAIANNGANHTETYVANLGQAEPLSRVALYPRTDSPNQGQNFPIDFTISTSTDGVNWTAQVTRTNYPEPTSGAAQTFYFSNPPIASRFVRVDGTNLRNEQGGYYFALAELGIG
jgi:hypothetical protein